MKDNIALDNIAADNIAPVHNYGRFTSYIRPLKIFPTYTLLIRSQIYTLYFSEVIGQNNLK